MVYLGFGASAYLATASVDDDPPILMLLQFVGAIYCTGLGSSSELLIASRQSVPYDVHSRPTVLQTADMV